MTDSFRFNGVRLASQRSRFGWGRYTDLVLYREENAGYVLHIIGASDLPGEHTKHTLVRMTNVKQLVAHLLLPKQRGMSRVGRRLLRSAAEHDSALGGFKRQRNTSTVDKAPAPVQPLDESEGLDSTPSTQEHHGRTC